MASAILLVGVVAALSVFPPGLDAIEFNRKRTVAARLAELEIERWKLRRDSVPLAISCVRGGSVYALECGVAFDPENLAPNEDDPAWLPDSVYQVRTVIGEVEVLPSDVQTASGATIPVVRLPLVKLAFTPVAHLFDPPYDDPDSSEYRDPFIIYTTAYKRVDVIDLLVGAPSSADREQCYIDYSSGDISFDYVAEFDRHFRVEYLWLDSSGPAGPLVQREWVEIVSVAAGEDTVRQPKKLAAALRPQFQGVVWGSERVHRAFTRVGQISDLKAPGQYFVDTQAFRQGRSDVALLFPAQEAGKRVFVDYRVRDWQILREEKAVPDDGKVKLLFSHIKDDGFKQPARILTPQPVDPDVGASVIALDLESGRRLIGWPNPPDANHVQVDYFTGTLTFPSWAIGGTYRIHYRAIDDWTVQVSKSASQYGQSFSGAPGFRSFVWDGVRPELFFSPADAGAAVAVDYWVQPTGGGPRRLVDGEVFRLSTPANLATPQKGSFISLRLPTGTELVPGAPPTVRGVSLQVRVVWIGRGSAQTVQGTKISEQWRQRQADFYFPAGAT